MRLRLLIGLSMIALVVSAQAEADERLPVLRGIGGDFSAWSTLGRELSLKELRGQPLLVFFGYTNCADVCPATLGHLSNMTFGDPDAVQVLFITVDPEYDTPAHLKDYLAYFDERYIGISDKRQRIDEIVALFQARYNRLGDRVLSTDYKKFKIQKEQLDSARDDKAFLYSHSATIYLLDKQGRARATYFTGTPIAQMRADIESLNHE